LGTIINAIKDFTVNTLGKVWTQGINAWTKSENWHSTLMSYKIDIGLFRGSFQQVLSRFAWEATQTFLGKAMANIQNTFYGVKDVSYYDGATAVETYSEKWGAFTLGNYIMGERGLHADPYNSLFQHEYGHYLQSQNFGYFYIKRCGLPSLFDAMKKSPHNSHPVEQDANIRAFKYFKKHIEGYDIVTKGNPKGWYMGKNNIHGYKTGLDFNDPINQAALRSTLTLGWSDYVFGSLEIFPAIIINNILKNQ
jgi:hypothetical protein